ncbi:Signal peptidase complex subunit 2 [Gaertneriomyces sp. JEL0708]|nr:Signal peptidase complex subunit 2 [Gaertneriomyces sp. JEL0708]
MPSDTTTDTVDQPSEQVEASHPSSVVIETEAEPIKIATNNALELKHTLDDALRKILVDDLKFKEIHTHPDTRLAIGYAACAFAAFGSGYSYFIPFADSKLILALCVAAYFILNGVLVLYAKYVEQNIIFQGVKEDPLGLDPNKRIVVRTDNKRYTAEYTIKFELVDAAKHISAVAKDRKGGRVVAEKTLQAESTVTISKTFGDYFDEEGTFAARALWKDVSTVVNTGLKIE